MFRLARSLAMHGKHSPADRSDAPATDAAFSDKQSLGVGLIRIGLELESFPVAGTEAWEAQERVPGIISCEG